MTQVVILILILSLILEKSQTEIGIYVTGNLVRLRFEFKNFLRNFCPADEVFQ